MSAQNNLFLILIMRRARFSQSSLATFFYTLTFYWSLLKFETGTGLATRSLSSVMFGILRSVRQSSLMIKRKWQLGKRIPSAFCFQKLSSCPCSSDTFLFIKQRCAQFLMHRIVSTFLLRSRLSFLFLDLGILKSTKVSPRQLFPCHMTCCCCCCCCCCLKNLDASHLFRYFN